MLVTDLITDIRFRASIPTADINFTSAQLFPIIDSEIASVILPLVMEQMEEYYVADFPYNITSGRNAYQMPSRAIASMLRDVQVISSADPDSITPLERLQIENLFSSTSSSYRVLIKKSGFYLKGNTVYMYPTPNYTANVINLEYFSRPNSSVDPATCAVITAISGSTITVSSLPSNISTATLVDFVKVKSGFECTAIDQTITGIASTVLTMAAAPPSTLLVGDYVCQATQSCIVQVPQELLPLLSQACAVRVLSSQSDEAALNSAKADLMKLEKNAATMIAPRVQGKPKKVTNTRGVSRFV